MVLEAVMIVVDNSEPSRNGDYTPTRFDAQSDAVSILFQNITQGNPESSVGLMAMGGKGPEVLATLTTDQGKILEGLHRTKKKISGTAHLATGLQVAQVSLFDQNDILRETQKLGSRVQEADRLVMKTACAQAPTEQLAAAAHCRLCVLAHRRQPERPGQIGQEDEEIQHDG